MSGTDGPGAHAHADSSGMPWARREVSPSDFAGDEGLADPLLRAAMRELAAGPSSEGETRLVALVAAARWLVPLVAVAVDTAVADGRRVEGHSEMAAVTLTLPDGARALPVFSGLDALGAWDPQARPVPVSAATAAQSAVAEGCDTVLLDLGSDHALALRPSMVWALAMDRPWRPAHDDPVVAAGLAAALADEPEVLAHSLTEGEPAASGVLRVTLEVRPGLDEAAVHALATRVGERVAADGELRARIDGLAFALRAAG